jgi:TolB-like protein/Tfp pilus assembly protein PilF
VRDGQAVSLPPKDLETLVVLVERSGHVVSKDELLQKVWPGVFIEEGNLARHVFNLRQVLGEDPDGRKYIETVPKRGYRFIGVLEEHEEGQPKVPAVVSADLAPAVVYARYRRGLWLWSLVIVLAAAAALVLWRLETRNSSPQRVMLAVLPFVNLSGDAHEEYFADGLTEEMIAQLGQLQPAKLGVIARTSIVRYKNTKENMAQIGQELGVGYLLEGSVRRADGRVRITAQLIQAAPQTHVWAESYERPLMDVLSIQREIAERVTHSLSIELLPNNISAAGAAPVNLESYDKYLLGRHELELGTRESVGKAIEYFQAAIAEDANDARLYSALAKAYGAATTYYSSPAEVMPKAKEAALRAVQLDPNFASAHVDLGYARLFFDWDWAAADSEFRRALEINPSLPEAQLGYADYLGTLGRSDEALARVQQAYLYDPLNVESRNEALWIYYFSGRMPETIDQCRKVNELEPAAGTPYSVLAMAYAQMGNRPETIRAADQVIRIGNSASDLATVASALAQVGEKAQAEKVLNKALELAKHQYVCRFIVATAYTELGENEKALESLEQAFLQRST